MKEIYRENVREAIDNILTDIRKNVSLTDWEKDYIELVLEEQLDKLCGYPDYKK